MHSPAIMVVILVCTYVGLLADSGCTPLDVATATIKNNRELVLALGELHLEHVVQLMVATTTAVSNISSTDSDFEGGLHFTFKRGMTLARNSFSTSMEWSPSGGGKCLEFLQSAVWVEGKSFFQLPFIPIPTNLIPIPPNFIPIPPNLIPIPTNFIHSTYFHTTTSLIAIPRVPSSIPIPFSTKSHSSSPQTSRFRRMLTLWCSS